MLIDYIPPFMMLQQVKFFCTVSPKCQGGDGILFQLNCTRNYEEKRKGREWAPPPPVVFLIRLIKFLGSLEFKMIFTLKVHGLQIFYTITN